MTRSRFQSPVVSPNSDIGDTLPGALLNFYEVGSTTLRKDTFPQLSGGVANGNPVVADDNGRFPEIYFEGFANRVLTDAKGNQISARDNVTSSDETDPFLLADGSAGAPSYSYTSDTDLGHYRAANNVDGIAAGGNPIGAWSLTGLDITTEGEAVTPSLILEGDASTGWRRGATDAWTFASNSQDMLTLTAGKMTLSGRTDADAVIEIKALTGQISILRGSGEDVSHGLTPATAYYQVEPLSAAGGTALGTGASDADATALIFQGIIGVTDPTDIIPAIQVLTGKSDGATGSEDLAADETPFKLSNFNGATDYWEVNGAGDSIVPSRIIVAGGNVTASDDVIFEDSDRGVDFSAEDGGTGFTQPILRVYEEGTFVAELWDSSLTSKGSTTISVSRYTKIGNRVYFDVELQAGTAGSLIGTDQIKIGPLPYTSNDQLGSGNAYSGTSNAFQGDFLAGDNIMGLISEDTDYINLFRWSDSVGSDELKFDDWNTAAAGFGTLRFSGNYPV